MLYLSLEIILQRIIFYELQQIVFITPKFFFHIHYKVFFLCIACLTIMIPFISIQSCQLSIPLSSLLISEEKNNLT